MPRTKTTDPSAKVASKKHARKPVPKTKQVPKKEAAPPAPVAAPKPAPVPEVTAPDPPKTVSLLQEDFTSYLAKIQQAVSLLSTLRTEFRVLERKAMREIKAADKVTAKRKRKSGNRAPSGFVKPTLISDELANFLGKDSGTEMARTEVTREINAYIRAHDLQDKSNGRKINADDKLSSLLSLTEGDELTYFNLQKYMSRHFAKAKPKVEASV